jgi:type IX secretion system PorP/SprF family membrane protein
VRGKINTSIMILVLLFSSKILAQDFIVNPIYQNLVNINPSFAGSNGGIRIQTNYSQLYINSSAQDYLFSSTSDYKIKKINAGLGVSFYHEDLSRVFKNFGCGLVYSQQIKLNKHLVLIPALKASYIERTADLSKLSFYNNNITSPWPLDYKLNKRRNFDLTGSLLAQHKGMYIGFVVNHINQPDVGVLGPEKLSIHYTFHSSFNIQFNKSVLQLGCRIDNQNKSGSLNINTNLLFMKYFVIGLGYTTNSFYYTNIGFKHSWFGIYYNFYSNKSKLSSVTSYNHMFTATFSWLQKERRNKTLYFEEF